MPDVPVRTTPHHSQTICWTLIEYMNRGRPMWSIVLGAIIGVSLAIHGFAHWRVTTVARVA